MEVIHLETHGKNLLVTCITLPEMGEEECHFDAEMHNTALRQRGAYVLRFSLQYSLQGPKVKPLLSKSTCAITLSDALVY